MNYEHLQNTAPDAEILSADDEKLRRMLTGLKKVAAPANFDFQLKARIANAETSRSPQPILFPALRFVLPLAVVFLLAGFVVFNLFPANENRDAAVAENPVRIQREIETVPNQIVLPPAAEQTPPQALITDSSIAAVPANKNLTVINSAPEIVRSAAKPPANKSNAIFAKNSVIVRNDKRENDSNDDFLGSKDSTLKSSKVITRESSNPNFGARQPLEVKQNKLSLKGILSEIGIEADYDAGGWKIVSVKENSAAMRAGLKTGDLIEAIDGKKLSFDTDFTQNFSVKVFKILREGKQEVIDLTKKP